MLCKNSVQDSFFLLKIFNFLKILNKNSNRNQKHCQKARDKSKGIEKQVNRNKEIHIQASNPGSMAHFLMDPAIVSQLDEISYAWLKVKLLYIFLRGVFVHLSVFYHLLNFWDSGSSV